MNCRDRACLSSTEGAHSLAYDVSERQAFLGGPSLSDMPVGGEMVDYAL